MRLDFSVLVVDDEPATAHTFLEKVRMHLEEEGFELRSRLLSSASDVGAYLAHPEAVPPDIVLVDNALGPAFDLSSGDQWARRVRSVFPVTDILFYGYLEVGTLRQKVLSAGVDGVFCATRTDVAGRVIEILDIHISRWTAPGAMRGLAVGLAADLDEHLRNACADTLARQERGVRDTVYERIVKKAVADRDDRAKKFSRLAQEDNVNAIIRDVTFSADHVLQALGYAAEASPGSDVAAVKVLAERVRRDVLAPRNILAHGAFDAERCVFISAGAGKEWACTPENCREFRRALGAYRRELAQFARVARETGVLSPPAIATEDD